MTDPVKAAGSARLDELAAVTQEYARYSSERSGLAGVALGAWWVGVFAVALCSTTWGRIAALWGPLLTIGLVWAGRRYYQRFGRVLPSVAEPPAAPFRWRKWMWFVLLNTAVIVLKTAIHIDAWSGESVFAEAAIFGVLASAPAIPLLVERVVMAPSDDVLVSFSLLIAVMTVAMTNAYGPVVIWKFSLSLAAVCGVVLAGAGLQQHRSYRRLERRLAALKERA